MRMMGPADQAMINKAIAHARAAGVPAAAIEELIEKEGRGRNGAIVAPALAGRLNALANQYRTRQPPPAG